MVQASTVVLNTVRLPPLFQNRELERCPSSWTGGLVWSMEVDTMKTIPLLLLRRQMGEAASRDRLTSCCLCLSAEPWKEFGMPIRQVVSKTILVIVLVITATAAAVLVVFCDSFNVPLYRVSF